MKGSSLCRYALPLGCVAKVLTISILILLPVLAAAQVDFINNVRKGRYLEAESRGEERIKSASDKTAQNLAPLCYVYYKLRRYGKLFTCAAELDERIAAGDHIHEGRVGFGVSAESDVTSLPSFLRSNAYLELGDPQRSIDEGERWLSTLKEGYPFGFFTATQYRVEGLPTLGVAAAQLGRKKDAERYLKILADLDIPFIGAVQRKNLQQVGLARIEMALGRYEEALNQLNQEHYSFARQIDDLVTGAGDSDSAANLYALAKLLMMGKSLSELGRTAEAKGVLDKLINHKRAPEQSELYWVALFERGKIAEREGNTVEAIKYYQKAIEIVERQRASLATELAKIGFVGDKQAVYARLIAVLVAQGRIAEAFDYIEHSKSRALVDMLASKQDFAAPDPEKAKLVLAQLDAADLGAQMQNEGAKPDGQAEGTRNLQVAQQALLSVAPELSSLVTVTSVPSEELKSLLGADETLIEYYYQGNDMYAFILDRERLQAVQLDASEIAPPVQNLRKELEEPSSYAWQESSHALYLRLWKPLENRVSGKNIIVVAHGVLHYLPFAALQDDTGKFLIDRYSMRSLPSASVLKYLRPAMQKTAGRQLVLGNPDLGDPALDLQFAGDEAKMVAALFPGSRLLLRKDASESNFKNVAGVFSRIHFATHGKFQADEPLKSGLYLAKDADNDGVLTVSELYSMNLDADLVTLSACETGLGKIANGDDVVGLTRGFLYAGSRSIVASLWSVDDKATASLMQAFYNNLASMNKEDALRMAQIKVREAFPHPFYWAAFQLTGRTD